MRFTLDTGFFIVSCDYEIDDITLGEYGITIYLFNVFTFLNIICSQNLIVIVYHLIMLEKQAVYW